MKKKYLTPEMELIDLEDVDILTDSGDGNDEPILDEDVVGGNGQEGPSGDGEDDF